MRAVTVYTRGYCSFCLRAIALLERKGASVTEVDGALMEKRQEMIQRSGRFTFPQIFIGDLHIGGCDDLYALEREGRLDRLLAAEG